ncbi:Ribosomal protein S4E, central domain protein [Halorhabdus utahensis DSM 12940]|uniref:Small ribosomal subunit protein eS4 n=1 Tax=Halorhabdus utahensis (strain DSM 12940 / JCM 11049 / AX-2) TaxID=519442 RepID=C7NV59_HALUD|nr:30S ribosomal protein S4e [Halorhabdus utahensis]ACV12471.1 Ribosomal protein S4E, central domain protein [Halorhabdus utahensis DSM 12940]
MSNHQKRLSVPNSWPIERKTETFTVKADAGPHGEAGVPLLIVLRDVLGYVDSRKEARFALDQDQVLINGDPESDETRPVGMFDILAFTEREEFYRVFPGEGGRLALTPIDEDSAQSKLGKIVGKQFVPGGDLQLTLHDGETLLVSEDAPYEGNDSVVVENDSEEIVAHFEYEEGALVTAVDGQHAGEIGTIEEIQVTPGSAENNVRIDREDGSIIETIEEYVVVIDENFVEDDEGVEADDEAEADADDAADADADDEDAEADEADADAEAEEADGDDDEADGGDDE